MKAEHREWGSDYVYLQLQKSEELKGYKLPSPSSIWRYWRSFGDRLVKSKEMHEPTPPPIWQVHVMWQLDFKESLSVPGLGSVTFTHARDTVGRATVLHRIHPAEQPEQVIVKPTGRQVQADCRIAFAQWGLPDSIQTDHASIFVDDSETPFPKLLPLWWIGLGIKHKLLERSPIENGSVERCHRTMVERTISGRYFALSDELQLQLDADWTELNNECPSKARGCNGLPPTKAFPDLLHPRRHYFPEEEERFFSLDKVDRYLAQFTWVRKVDSHGRLSLGGQKYAIGRPWAGRYLSITFEPEHRMLVFSALEQDSQPDSAEILRPIQGLDAHHIIGSIECLQQPVPKQLHFPMVKFWPDTQRLQA